ncbi:MAG: GTP cyclohydrolase I FolE [Planctomycetota bacterium]
MVDKIKIEKAVRMILEAVGEEPDREGLAGTPARVARMYEELFSGLGAGPRQILSPVFSEKYDEIVLVRDIDFASMCEHHLLPFIGVAHVAYLPAGKVVGISKLARAVDAFARRPQLQERMTNQIADFINQELSPKGVAVVLRARHTCMGIRGIRKPDSEVVTSALRGIFKKNPTTRAELMSLLHGMGR